MPGNCRVSTWRKITNTKKRIVARGKGGVTQNPRRVGGPKEVSAKARARRKINSWPADKKMGKRWSPVKRGNRKVVGPMVSGTETRCGECEKWRNGSNGEKPVRETAVRN